MKKPLRSCISLVLCCAMLASTMVTAAAEGPPEGAGDVPDVSDLPAAEQEEPPEPLEQPEKIHEEYLDSGISTVDPTEPVTVEEIDEYEMMYGDPVEIGEYYKIYETGPGTYITMYTSVPVAYLDGGEWKEIDNTLVLDEEPPRYAAPSAAGIAMAAGANALGPDVYTNAANSLTVSLPEVLGGSRGVSVEDDGNIMMLIPTEGDYSAAAVKDNAIRYSNVFDGIDVQYTVNALGVKEDIILNQQVERNRFVYELKLSDGLSPVLEDGVISLFGDGPEPKGVISAPVMVDAAGETHPVELELTQEDGSCYVTVLADAAWLAAAERAYPVIIDPSMTVPPTRISTTTARSAYTQKPLMTASYSVAGYMTGADVGVSEAQLGMTRIFYKLDIDFSQVPDGAQISKATFRNYQYSERSNGQNQFQLYQVNAPWTSSDIIWSKASTIAATPVGQAVPSQNGFHEWDVTPAFQAWKDGTAPNYGFMLRAVTESTSVHGGAFYTSTSNASSGGQGGFTSDKAPTLIVEWTEEETPPEQEGNIEDSTLDARPLFEITGNNMITVGVYPYGYLPEGAVMEYTLWAEDMEASTGTAEPGTPSPDDSQYAAQFEGLIPYDASLTGNWQPVEADGALETNVLYRYSGAASRERAPDPELGETEPVMETSPELESCTFLLYPVSHDDIITKLANYYGVSAQQIKDDNHLPNDLMVDGDILYIRDPQQNTDVPYSFGGLTLDEEALIDQMRLGRAEHCSFGFEPINLNTGNFIMEQQDAVIPDYEGDFGILRTYNSQGAMYNGIFGRGWQFEYGEGLSLLADGTILYRRGDGSAVSFAPSGSGYEAPDGYYLTLEAKSGASDTDTGAAELFGTSYTLTDTSTGTVKKFNRYGLLTSIRTKQGFTTSLTYDDNYNLYSITSPAGKEYEFTCDAAGLVRQIRLPNGGTLSYEYDSRRNLVSFTDAMGGTTEYTYDGDSLLLTATDADGNTFVDNTYDGEGRVVRQLDATGNETTLEYGDGFTVTTDANGNETTYHYDENYYTTSVEYPDGTSESMEYDGSGNLISAVDQAGKETLYEYDDAGNLTALTRWDGAVRRFEYNDANQVVKITDFDGKVTSYSYSTSGDLLQVTNNDGTTIVYEYNDKHQPVKQTGAGGHVTQYEYDGPWLSALVDAEGHRTEFYYNAMGLATSMVDANGGVTRIGYDLSGRTIMEQSADGAATYYEYSPAGYVLSITDPNGYVSQFEYDPNGNIVLGTDPLGGTLERTYDAVWNMLSETDARGITTEYTYDSMNRVSSVTDGDGNTTTYTYDALGNVAAITDPKGNVTEYEYDYRFSLPSTAADALGNVTALEYDAVGNVLKQTNADGSVLLYEYDNMNRINKTTDAAGLETVLSYDADGNITGMEDNAGRTLSYLYNKAGLPVEVTLPNGGKLTNEYDALGNLISQTDAMGNKTVYTYDAVGRVLSITDALGNKTQYSYDSNGNLLSLMDALGGETSYQYDALDRLRIAEDPLESQTVVEYDGSDNISVVRNALGAEWQYQYNGRDLPSAVTDPMGSVYTLSYDENGNNTQLQTPDGGVAVYEYDALNRLVKSTDAQGLITEYAYDSMGRLVKQWDNAGNKFDYIYDGAGRLTEMWDALEQPTKYEYDIAGNITAITTYDGNRTEYTYDAMGNVLTATDAENKTVTYEYDLNNNLLGQEDHLHRQWKYAYDAINRLVRDENPAEAANQYEYDALGNVTKITNAAGYSQLYTYDALGNLTSFTDENGNATGYEYDALGRVIRSAAADGGETEYQYDALDRPITVRDPLGNETLYGYDVMSNQTSVTRPEGGVYQYTYNFHGAATSMTDPLGNVTEYTVDLNDRLTHKRLPTGAEYGYEYDLIGRLTKLTQPEGMWDAFTYDGRGDIVKQTDEGGRETTWTYDIMHRLLTTTNAEGHTTSYAYNDAGILSELTTALGYKTTYEYDILDQVVSVQDPVGMVTKFEYDILGNPVKTTVNDQHPTSYAYDPVGNLTSVTNALDQTVSYEYDVMNRQVKDVSTAGKIQAYGYDLNGQLTSATNRLGGVAEYAYDGNGNLISYTDEEDYKIEYTYDLADRLIQAQEGDAITSYTYDGVGNLTSATNGEGQTTQYGYDLADRMVSITNPLDQVQRFQYDISGRLEQTENPNGTTVTYDYDKLDQLVNKEASGREDDQALYGYDADGRMVTMEDVTGSNSYEYDGVNRITAVNLFNGLQIRYEYDEFGNLARLVYPDGTENSYTYDVLNRMVSATDRRGETTTYEYDLAGNVVRIDRPNKTYTTIEYNDMDQVTKLVNYSKGKELSSFQYEYDLSGFIVKEIASQAKEETVTSTYAYDYRCQLVRVRMTTESGPVIEREYAYDKAGNRIMEETTSDGAVTRRVESAYDDAGRLISQEIWEDSAPEHGGGPEDPEDPDDPGKPHKPHHDNGHHYGNDKGDNHIDKKGQQKDGYVSNAEDPEAIANNTAELLPPAVYDSGTEAWSGKYQADETVSYTYDENGNLIEKSGSNIDNFVYQYDNENRLRAVMQNGTVLMAALYDGNGDRIFKLQRHSTSGNVPSSGEDEKENNGKGNDKNVPHGNKKTKELLAEEQEVSAEASEAQVQTFSSNSGIPVDLALLEDVMLLPTGANKTNIESFDLTGYINDVNRQYTQVLMEYGKNGKYTSIYSYGLQRLGADYNGAQTVYLYDGRGSMVHETNGSGTSMSSYLYDEWGNLLSGKVHTNGFYSDLFLYNGEATDITTGLQYLRARYYDPEMGRFIQQDSFLGYIQTPLSLNLYIYVRNNPLNYMDPSGNLGDFVDRRVIPGKEDMTWYEQFQERIRMNQRDNSIYSINKIDDQLLDLSLAYSRTEPGVERLKLRVQMDDLRAKRSSYCGDFFEVAKTTEYGALPPNFFKDLNKLTYLQELLLDSRAKGNKTQLLNALSQSMRQASTQDEYNALLNAYNYILQDRTTFSPVETSVSVGIYMEDLSFTEDTREATTTAAELVNSIYPSVPGTLFVIGQHLSAEDWDAVRDDLWGVAGDKLLDSTVASQFGPLLPILGTGIAFAILS